MLSYARHRIAEPWTAPQHTDDTDLDTAPKRRMLVVMENRQIDLRAKTLGFVRDPLLRKWSKKYIGEVLQ